MTKRELLYTVFERLKVSSDDSDLSEEFVSSLIDSTRALIIKQTYGGKGWNLPVELKQELCLSVVPTSKLDYLSCFGTILHTEDVIPKGISMKGVDGAVLRLKVYDRESIAINIVPMERLPMLGHNIYTAQMIYAAIDINRKIYIVSQSKKHSFLEAIKVEGIYEYPEEAGILECRATNKKVSDTQNNTRTTDTTTQPLLPCDFWDEEYPLEAAAQDTLIDIIVKQLLKRESLPEDNVNDAEDVRR